MQQLSFEFTNPTDLEVISGIVSGIEHENKPISRSPIDVYYEITTPFGEIKIIPKKDDYYLECNRFGLGQRTNVLINKQSKLYLFVDELCFDLRKIAEQRHKQSKLALEKFYENLKYLSIEKI